MNINLLKYPTKSHRKTIKTPRESIRLAELIGIEFGDGGINNPWQVVITLNADKDEKYAEYVVRLIRELFGIEPVVRKRGKRTLQIVSSSISLVDFLVKKGAVRGNKIKQMFDIPNWVGKNDKYSKVFVRGLVDTDGCLYIHRHKIKGVNYKNIGFCFTSYSRNLLNSVASILRKSGIESYIKNDGRSIYLYGKNAVENYINIFGSSNPRIFDLYKKWRDARAV
ncbi:TPA: hypothetical protein DCZ15_02380 [Candidatus Falkowbacteria bacterium]|nr:MAG: hypothetical protein UV95_C0001G0131 [Candidatus Falkowbacteria bacterium GW2011_GWF2_43_32]HBA36701.1 hypothetical protein [Candidatus Falkowbacteria bacterium]